MERVFTVNAGTGHIMKAMKNGKLCRSVPISAAPHNTARGTDIPKQGAQATAEWMELEESELFLLFCGNIINRSGYLPHHHVIKAMRKGKLCRSRPNRAAAHTNPSGSDIYVTFELRKSVSHFGAGKKDWSEIVKSLVSTLVYPFPLPNVRSHLFPVCTLSISYTLSPLPKRSEVLTLQSVLSVFFSGAVASYALCQFDVVCSPVKEHFIMEYVSFMALFSPMITLYCMKSYKEFVLSIVCCYFTEIKRSVNDISTTRGAELHSN
ncbi:hypothetical protein PRIPAC_76867, partial [Pristionchus pacificus]|uniref:G protein-coupled receptor n=1 Tax=Pristionchus pacificus TaxID=54126 RepID=A0A2A6CKB1_PRIPA